MHVLTQALFVCWYLLVAAAYVSARCLWQMTADDWRVPIEDVFEPGNQHLKGMTAETAPHDVVSTPPHESSPELRVYSTQFFQVLFVCSSVHSRFTAIKAVF